MLLLAWSALISMLRDQLPILQGREPDRFRGHP